MRKDGFTLAELLIALLILGVVATFTIPKVLQSQQSSQYKSNALEVASMISGAYDAYRQQNTVTVNTSMADLTPYMNYVARNSTTPIDQDPFWGATFPCTGAYICLKLHNGGTIIARSDINFGETAATNAIWAEFDPDSKAVQFSLFWGSGRLSSMGTQNGTVCNSGACIPAGSGLDPAWFSWN